MKPGHHIGDLPRTFDHDQMADLHRRGYYTISSWTYRSLVAEGHDPWAFRAWSESQIQGALDEASLVYIVQHQSSTDSTTPAPVLTMRGNVPGPYRQKYRQYFEGPQNSPSRTIWITPIRFVSAIGTLKKVPTRTAERHKTLSAVFARITPRR